MPHVQDPASALAPCPRFGRGSATRSLPRTLLAAAYCPWPAQKSPTCPPESAVPLGLEATYGFQDANSVKALTLAAESRAPEALPSLRIEPPAEYMMGEKA